MVEVTGPAVVRDRVQEQLARIPGAVTSGQDGAFLVFHGAQATAVQVVGLQPDVTLVVVYGVIATDVRRVDQACRFLATRALDLRLVHVELVGGKNLIAVHDLLGEFLSMPDLAAAIDAVGAAVATLGPQVRAEFGGADIADLASPVDPAAPNWLVQPAQPLPSVRAPVPPRPTRVVTVGATALVLALVAAAWAWWGAGSGVAVALVLAPLLGALVVGPSLRRSRRIT